MERSSCTTEHMWGSEGNSQEMVLYFYYLSSRDQSQVMKLANKHLCLLSHFTSPSLQVALFYFKRVHVHIHTYMYVHIHACGYQETTLISFSGTQSTPLRESLTETHQLDQTGWPASSEDSCVGLCSSGITSMPGAFM